MVIYVLTCAVVRQGENNHRLRFYSQCMSVLLHLMWYSPPILSVRLPLYRLELLVSFL